MNNVLVIIDGQDEKKVFSFPSGLTEQECFDKIKHSMESGVKRKFFFKNSEVSPKTYEEYYHLVDNDLVLNERFFLETEITKKIRNQRDMLIQRLDVPFMISLETENDLLKNHVITLKNFLRDVPNNLDLKKIKEKEDLLKFTPFQNIFTASIVDAGSGYEKPPKITFQNPDNEMYYGYPAEITATIKEGSLSNLFFTNNGCSYVREPKVMVTPPEDPDGKPALVVSGPIENTISMTV